MNARNIFGPDVPSLKGNTSRRKKGKVHLESLPIPKDEMARHKDVVVCFDVMYLNGIAFSVSIS